MTPQPIRAAKRHCLEGPAIADTPRDRQDYLTVADNILEFRARRAAHTDPDHGG
ncbi:hypothetical protein [Streptomyces spectabilis]|uniref:hypothetical protein n=1 Tax=Streptomyces spectabilis TaxID=68270 RepID=UPI00137712DE|nr:hypothetical protein [Streptomyces spectabilis]